ncbi:protein GVQW3-like [Aphis gossypii]|uniref:protein GVQW3-like n=1 Tax=Aphis gossypii TaxID=80765 RepID=UPI002158E7FB|nr:protein GVQW3-like [Aphis gossypii]
MAEQRAAVKFCFLLGKTGTETLEMLKTAYKGDALGKTQVFEWFSRFKSGEMSIEDQARSGRPSTSLTDKNVKNIHKINLEDRRKTIEEVAERSGVTWSSVQRILSENLGMKRVAAKFVPRLLTEQQKQGRFTEVFDQKWYDHCVPSTLFTRPGSL